MRSDILGPVDTAFFYVESPETPMNIGAMLIFEGKVSFDDLLELIDSRIYQAPLYQQRIVQAPFNLGTPTWAFDPDFHVGNHVFRTTLNAPGTDEQLRELAGTLVSGMLDRNKPLWQVYQIEGLQGDRSALFFKVHHCMVDGLSAVELFTILLDLGIEPPPLRKKPLYDPPVLPTSTDLLLDTIRRELPFKFSMLQKIQHDANILGSVLADKEKRRKALVGVANLINDNLKSIRPLLINGKNTGRITLAWAEFSLAEVRAIRSKFHASVNDVMLTVLGGAVDSYLKKRGETANQNFLRVLIPVNMRLENEKGDFGNRISILPIDVPLRAADPLERLRVVTEYTQIMKQSSLSNGVDLTLTLPALAPAIAQPLIWKIAPAAFAILAHTWCTNVAGPQIPVYLMGHRMLHSFGFFPLNPSMGLATVVTSYDQHISMTLVADAGIVPDVTELARHLEVAYLVLRKAANVPETEPIALERPKSAPAPVAASPVAAPAPPAVAQSAPLTAVTVSPTASPIVTDAPAQAEPVNAVAAPSNGSKPPEPVVGPVSQTMSAQPAPIAISPAANPLVPDAPAEVEPVSAAAARSNGSKPPELIPVLETVPQAPASEAAQVPAVVSASPPAVSPATPAVAVEHTTETTVNVAVAERPKLFSEAWAQAYRKAINNSPAYYNASTRWDAGALAFIMKASPANDFPQATAVLLDLYKGKCLAARSLPPAEAQNEAAFVIEGEYANWIKVLSGQAQPLVMLMTGKLYLKKGGLARLLPFTQSAQELVHSAQGIA